MNAGRNASHMNNPKEVGSHGIILKITPTGTVSPPNTRFARMTIAGNHFKAYLKFGLMFRVYQMDQGLSNVATLFSVSKSIRATPIMKPVAS